MENIPDYRRIYTDLINEKFPEKKEALAAMLSKQNFSILDVITCSSILSGKEETVFTFNQKHRSFDRQSILEILTYQKNNQYNNAELARHFNLSRNTIARWKKKFL
ncbi:helix-turn-helix domain-containing protein [Chryseobacterium kwangjuense]|uniref:Helix-turn-helix domain-containing protein n=1 Tax=Chryseobacterium kwangjuense TaxID=267125 RepID=A0A135WHF2_9FLAO|nr:helix-turn-helix domain-containing protein [Chryseobacterium kwangjuense]KXH84323.1 transposase [Chryseobacterium kwangjuense]